MITHKLKKINVETEIPKLISPHDASEILDVCVRTVWRFVASGDLPKPIKVGRSSKFYLSDILNYISSRTKRA